MRPKPVAILCGRYDQYWNWIFSLTGGRFPKEYLARIVRPVANERDIRGAEFSTYFIIGTFWDRRDANRLLDIVSTRIKLTSSIKRVPSRYSLRLRRAVRINTT